MKKILVLVLCLLFVFPFLLKSNVLADEDTVAVVDDDGDVVYYRGSSEAIMRASSYNYPVQSLRATWASCFIGSVPSFSNEAKWISDCTVMLDRLEEYGLNTLVFHVRTHNNALYKSTLNPLATFYKNVNFDEFDPTEWLIEECHRRGIEFHAWLNPYRVLSTYVYGDYPVGNPARDSSNLLSNGSGTILNPGIPEVRDFIVATCMEIVENYDVDAIHFDDYFYISDIDDSATRQKYNTTGMSVDNWRRHQVDLFIEDLSNHIREYNQEHHKCVQLGIAPSGIYQNGSYKNTPTYDANGNLKSPLYSNTSGFAHYGSYLYADTLNWINHEWIDYIMPQTYWSIEHSGAGFADLARWWSWAVRYKKVNLYLGMGIYMPASGSTGSYAKWQLNKYEIRDQILVAQTHPEIGGVCFYSYNYINNSNTFIKTGMDIVKNDYFKTKTPADVKQYYAGVYDKPMVEDIKVTGDKVTYKQIDNIRGFVIYKMSNDEINQGKLLDQTDIKYVYDYTTKTTLTLSDVDNYTYYIATVNLANEISEAQVLKELIIDAAYVMRVIDAIGNIDSTSGVKLAKVKALYDTLDIEEQALVTNYDKLTTAYELLDNKIFYLNYVENYGDLSLYTAATQSALKTLKKQTKTRIEQLQTSEDVIAEYETFLDTYHSYPTAEAELREPKANAKQELNDYYNSLELTYFRQTDQTALKRALQNGLASIDEAESKTKVTEEKNKALNKLKSYTSFKDEYVTFITNLRSALNDNLDLFLYQNQNLDIYSEDFNEYIEILIDQLESGDKENQIDHQEQFHDDAVTSLETFEDQIKSLYRAIKYALIEIDETSEKKEGAKELKEEYHTLVENASSEEEVNNLLAEFNSKYEQLGKDTKPVDPDTPSEKSSCNNKGIILLLYTLISSAMIVFLFKKRR